MNIDNHIKDFFTTSLKKADPDLCFFLSKELQRQQEHIELIASENFVSAAVLEAISNVTTNKYAEGYPGKRYYGGCEYVDGVESLAIDRAKALFNCEFANVQPNSGSQANQGAFFATLSPGDTILSMSLNDGGHLTHGAAPNMSGRWFNIVQYGVDLKTGFIDYNIVEELALKHKPKMIIAGASAYPRKIDFKAFSMISKKVGAILLADVAHYAGLIAAGLYPSPMEYADIVTTTTHKTLRGPRGGMILSNNPDLFKKLNSAIFPGIQGGPIMNIIAAKAVAFREALQPTFKVYCQNVIENAQTLGNTLKKRSYKLVSDGTDCHLMLVDLSDKSITGKDAEAALDMVGIVCNKNTVPGEQKSPFITSGIRLGSPACTTRGFNSVDFNAVGELICLTLDSVSNGKFESEKEGIKSSVHALCKKYPIYPNLMNT